MTTAKLFGVSEPVATAMFMMSHHEFLEIGISLMNRVQVKQVNDYNSNEFKDRAKAIKNYQKWLKDNGF